MAEPTSAHDELPFSVTLSRAELIALIRWHSSQAKRVTKAFGTIALKLQAERPFGSVRDLKALSGQAKEMLAAHTTRAKGLMALLPP